MSVNYTENSTDQHNGSTRLAYEMSCMTTRPGSIVYSLYFILNSFLLLPSCILIFNQDLQQWRQRRSTSSAPAAQKPMDLFDSSYALIELLTIIAQVMCCCGIHTSDVVLEVGYYLWTFVWFGEISFHVLACLERYIAVVHPVAFLRLRGKRGFRIRNIILSCIGLFCIGGTALISVDDVFTQFTLACILFTFVVLSIFSLSVLCTLIRLASEQHGGGKRGTVDQSKKVAFYMIAVILGTEFLKLMSNILWAFFNSSTNPSRCVVIMTGLWFCIPSAQVIPFLILQKAGIIICGKQKN